MRTQTPTLLAMVLLGMLAVDSRAQTSEDANCIADMISQAGVARQARAMVPMVLRILEQFKSRGGPTKAVEKMSNMLRMCTCSGELPKATNAELCQCTQEMKDCDVMHRPNSTTAPEDVQARFIDFMDCMGNTRLVSAIACQERLISNPVQMVCEAQEVTCQ
ncbi:uncharacterized protein LOC127007215 [Eriocheir sinensis]|uniref:uncharacterized protein LOC127007215 n=1 Tax=Eriocheir sinensis TaxID=95602 RepID=UPI0021C88826|nr:uncharacterized protein LOC127007215 [Eriocheir sinensis]